MSLTNLMYKGVHFDSDEEVFVAMWLQELQEVNFIKKWLRTKEAIKVTEGFKIPYTKITKLKTKIKKEKKEHTVLRPSEYTTDFEVYWTFDGWDKFINPTDVNNILFSPDKFLYASYYNKPMLIEVKPSFDQNNMTREFKLNQKFLWDKYKIFVNLVEPLDLFKKTFLPLEAEPYFRYKKVPKKAMAAGKKTGDFKFDWKPKTLKQFLNTN